MKMRKPRYYAHIKRSGDYSIACGEVLIKLDGLSFDEAMEDAKGLIIDAEVYSNEHPDEGGEEGHLTDLLILEVSGMLKAGLEAWYREANELLDSRRRKRILIEVLKDEVQEEYRYGTKQRVE